MLILYSDLLSENLVTEHDVQLVIISTPMGVDIFLLFPVTAIRHHTWFPVISRKSIYPIFTKLCMGMVNWYGCLLG